MIIKDISIPASIVIIFLILERAGFLKLLVDLLRSKINGSNDITTREAIDNLAENHLHEVKDLLIEIRNLLYNKFDDVNKNLNDVNKNINNLETGINNRIIEMRKDILNSRIRK
jgi:peptidoglycan hydrolase CwlO-like protein